jgi:hypothetical protein
MKYASSAFDSKPASGGRIKTGHFFPFATGPKGLVQALNISVFLGCLANFG